MNMYSITYPLITFTTAILNLPINSFCPLDTALVLTSDDFHSNFLPSIPSSLTPSCGRFSKTLMWCRLYHVFTYIYSLLTKKDICDHWNVSVKLLYVYVRLSYREHFFGKIFSFLFLFLCYLYFSTFPFHIIYYVVFST